MTGQCRTYEFGDRFVSVVPLEAGLSLLPPGALDAPDDVVLGVARGGRSAGADGAEGARAGYDLGLASRSTEGGASGAAGADATAVVMLFERPKRKVDQSGLLRTM